MLIAAPSPSCVTACATRFGSAVHCITPPGPLLRALLPSLPSSPAITTSRMEPRTRVSTNDCGHDLRGRKPVGESEQPKDSTYPWSSTLFTHAGTAMPSVKECPDILLHTCERRVDRSIRLPPLLPLPSWRTLQRRICPTWNIEVRSSRSSSSSSSSSDSDSDSDASEGSSPSGPFLPLLDAGASTSEASARVTVPFRPFGSETVSPRSLTSVTTPSTFMPTRRFLYLSSSTYLPSPTFLAPATHAVA